MQPLIRIMLRYIAGFLLAAGYLSEDFADMLSADEELVEFIAMIAGATIASATELWYYLSKRFGWNT